MLPETSLGQAQEAHLRLVRFLRCENVDTMRGKASTVGRLADRMSAGMKIGAYLMLVRDGTAMA